MRKSLAFLSLVFLLAFGSTACGKKKTSSATSAPVATPASPAPVINPQTTNPNLYSTMPQNYCGAYPSNVMNPYTTQYTYDPTYGVDWYSYGGISYYYYQGYFWYYGDCNSLYTYAPSYYYSLVYYPSICYTCQTSCYSSYCNSSTQTDDVDDYVPNTCTGKYKSFYTSATMNASLYDSYVYTKHVTLNESQTYYLIFEGKYTGASQTNEKAEVCMNGSSVKTIKDLDNSSSNSGTGNIYTHRCYLELCLSKGDNKFQFRGRWDSLYMNRFELTTTKPSLPSCE